jgi:hypothetical protein
MNGREALPWTSCLLPACSDMAACVSRDCVSNADGNGLLRCLPIPTRIPEKGRKGPLQGGHFWGVVGDPSVVGVGLLDVQGPGTRSEREEWAGDWRPCCPFSARGRCPHGPCSKKFRLQHLAVQGDDAHTDNPFAMATNSIKLLTGNSYPQLAQLVADRYVDAILEHFRALLLAQVPTPA